MKMFKWTRDFYAFFGLATAILMFHDDPFNANTWLGFMILGVIFTVGRLIYFYIKEKVIEKINGQRTKRWSPERGYAHTHSRRNSPKPSRESGETIQRVQDEYAWPTRHRDPNNPRGSHS